MASRVTSAGPATCGWLAGALLPTSGRRHSDWVSTAVGSGGSGFTVGWEGLSSPAVGVDLLRQQENYDKDA